MRGPSPKPTVIRKLEGNPSKRAFNELEPRPEALTPARAVARCPKDATLEQREKWRHFARKLAEAKILTHLDLDALWMLVNVTIELEKLDEYIRRVGYIVKDQTTGRIHQNPAIPMRDKAREMQRKLLQDFGMLPGPRSRVQIGSSGSDTMGLMDLLMRDEEMVQ
jgi:P27 family predicted phage terminase small subunit